MTVHSDHRKRPENTQYLETALNGVNGVKSVFGLAPSLFCLNILAWIAQLGCLGSLSGANQVEYFIEQ